MEPDAVRTLEEPGDARILGESDGAGILKVAGAQWSKTVREA